jgi:hypothetical protein
MKRLLLLALVGVVVLSSAPLPADDGFYVIAVGSPNPGTKITSLPYVINNPGFYYLTQNLTYSGTSNAITVSADNVTLDLMGFRLISTATSGNPNGVYMFGRKNVEVKNGTLRGFWTGIYEQSTGANHRVTNVRAIYGTIGGGSGIWLSGNGHLVKDCNASNNNYIGIYVGSGTVADCVAGDNGATGIRILGPGDVLGNAVFNNSVHNFDLGNGVATAIMADRNSAFGCNPNYYVILNTEGVQWGINAGAP